MENLLRKEFPIVSYHLDPTGKARLTTLANFFQEVAYQHANRLGFGYRDLKKNRTLWVLSRLRIRMERYPVWDEVVTVETWHRGMEKLFGMRDFRVKDQQGRVLGVAGSAWLIVDMDTRRPVRPDRSLLQSDRGTDAVFEQPLQKIEFAELTEPETARSVVHSDLDIVGHVNNVKYIEWCMDVASADLVEPPPVREFEINYLHEAMPGDRIGIAMQRSNPGDLLFSARKEGDNVEIFRARIAFDQRTE